MSYSFDLEAVGSDLVGVGAGVGTGGGTLAFGVKENNFLGRGIKFGTDLTLSQESLKGEISLNNFIASITQTVSPIFISVPTSTKFCLSGEGFL